MIWSAGDTPFGRVQSLLLALVMWPIVAGLSVLVLRRLRSALGDAVLTTRLERAGTKRVPGFVILRGRIWSDVPGKVIATILKRRWTYGERYGVLEDSLNTRRFWLQTPDGSVAVDAREGAVSYEYPGPPGFSLGLHEAGPPGVGALVRPSPRPKGPTEAPCVSVGDLVTVGGRLHREQLPDREPSGFRDAAPSWVIGSPPDEKLIVTRRDVVAHARFRTRAWIVASLIALGTWAMSTSALGASIVWSPSLLKLTPFGPLLALAAATLVTLTIGWFADQEVWWLRTLGDSARRREPVVHEGESR